MGASQSSNASTTKPRSILQEDLARLNQIVNSVVTENDIFSNSEYNFLSQDVCKKYQVILESDLNKQLKIDIKSIGESLLLIPREEERQLLDKRGLKKDEICTKIANHYLRILYVLCLIKYVYNIEKHGDLSIAGILFRKIDVTKNTIRIDFCKDEQKDLKNYSGEEARMLDVSGLAGFKFFVEYFLEPEEATAFIKTMRHILSRKSNGLLKQDFCEMGAKQFTELEQLYLDKTKDKTLTCTSVQKGGSNRLKMPIARDGPIFEQSWCYSFGSVTIPLAEADGQTALKLYKRMRYRYNKNVKDIESLLEGLVEKRGPNDYTLKDITKDDLDGIIMNLKIKVKVFYLQSLIDFQDLLDQAKSFPKSIVV